MFANRQMRCPVHSFQPVSRAKMGGCRRSIPERIRRCDNNVKALGANWTCSQFSLRRQEFDARRKMEEVEAAQKETKSAGQRPAAAGRGRGVDRERSKRAMRRLDEKILFNTWRAGLPRWVLTTRTDFAWRLARSFFVRWRSQRWRSAAIPFRVPLFCRSLGGRPMQCRCLASRGFMLCLLRVVRDQMSFG